MEIHTVRSFHPNGKRELAWRTGRIRIIHTCERAKTSAIEYMRTLIANPAAVAKAPADWMPWNYTASVARLKAAATPQPA